MHWLDFGMDANGNTSGATFDWDFTVWSATNNEGYSVGSNHTFTVTSGTMSNGKMYGYNILSSWRFSSWKRTCSI